MSYGLGSENENLPAYVVLDDPLGLPVNGIDNWHSGFLPANHQGTRFRGTGSPVLNLKPDYDQPDSVLQFERELITRLDRIHARVRPHRPQLDARISIYALAARMQIEATDALDLSQDGQRLAFGSTTGALWVSEDQGDRWTEISAHLPPVYCVRFG